MTEYFQLESSMILKKEAERLLMVSTTTGQDEVFEFNGKSSELLSQLFANKKFSLDMVQTKLEALKADPKDFKVLWDFCLEKKIIVPAA